jgi:hypothetical protein
MHSLQQLEMKAGGWGGRAEPALQQVVSSTNAQLRSLTLEHTSLFQEEMDVLLTHATQLTRLSCSTLNPSVDRSQSACSWRELEVRRDKGARTLAYLPLRSVTRFTSPDTQLPSPCPRLRYMHSSDLRNALLNLGSCPAWQQSGPAVHITCTAGSRSSAPLAPLHLLAGKRVGLSFINPFFTIDAVVAQTLHTALGARLTHLEVRECRVLRGFWPAVSACLPAAGAGLVRQRPG